MSKPSKRTFKQWLKRDEQEIAKDKRKGINISQVPTTPPEIDAKLKELTDYLWEMYQRGWQAGFDKGHSAARGEQ